MDVLENSIQLDKLVQDKVKSSIKNDESVAIFGATGGGVRVLYAMADANMHPDIQYIVDNDKKRQGKFLNGIPIKSPAELKKAKVDKVIVAIKGDISDVKKQLSDEGINSFVNIYS